MSRKVLFRIGIREQSKSCPNCTSHRVHRSRRRNFVEKTLFRAVGLYPYRCEECDERYFTLGKIPESSVRPLVVATEPTLKK